MVMIGSEGLREITDVGSFSLCLLLDCSKWRLTQGAYSICSNLFCNPNKKQEILEKRIGELERLEARKKLTQTEKELSTTLYEHGIDDQGFARIRSKGDQALFGGRTTIEMKKKLGIPAARLLADFLPTITIKLRILLVKSPIST